MVFSGSQTLVVASIIVAKIQCQKIFKINTLEYGLFYIFIVYTVLFKTIFGVLTTVIHNTLQIAVYVLFIQ